MEDKKKILFALVGTRDPYSDEKIICSLGPVSLEWNKDGKAKRLWKKFRGQRAYSEGTVLTACKWLNPDIVYLFPSSKEKAAGTSNPNNQTEDNANEVQQILTSQFGIKECNVMPLMTDNVTDSAKLYSCLRNNMRKIFNSLTKPDEQDYIKKRYELIFIRGSGTTQMKETASLVLQSFPYEFKEYECKAPIYAKDKDRVIAIPTKLASETLLLKSIEANVDGYYFHSVVENCDKLNQISDIKPRKSAAAIIKEIFTAYEYVDLMQYESAYKKISQASNFYNERKEQILEKHPVLPLKNICDILNRQAKFLENLKLKVRIVDESEDVNNLIDLCYNMERAYIRGNYVDVLARFWRLREGMMNYRLLKYKHLNRRNLKKSFSNKEDEKQRKYNYDILMASSYSDRVDWDNGRVRNDISAMVSLLTGFFDDKELKKFEDHYNEQLKYLKDSRNQTIVAHGMLPVSKDTADMCMNLAKGIINLIPDGKEVYDNYPFKLENMREVLNLLKYI